MKIIEAIDSFINYCIFEKGLSDKTKESYKNDLLIYQKYLKRKHIEEASAQLIDVSDYDDTKKDDLLDWLRNNI